MNNYILYAIATAILWGISGPMVKSAYDNGMHTDGYAVAYMVGLALFVTHTGLTNGPGVFFPNIRCLVLGLMAGIVTAVGFKTCSIAFSAKGSVVSIIVVLTASYPVITNAISMAVLKEFDKVVLWKVVVGTVLATSGAILVATSNKSALIE